jgi:hypothetical protein
MNIKTQKIVARNLKAGDLFSKEGELYWNNIAGKKNIAEKLYVRTEVPADNADDADSEVYKITIQKDD